MTKLRPLQDLNSFSLEGNPVASMEHSWQFVIFQLRSLKLLDGKEIADDDRQMADERFAQGKFEWLVFSFSLLGTHCKKSTLILGKCNIIQHTHW